MWVFILTGVLFIALGLAVHIKKWYFLLSGYNTMSQEKKANVDVESIGRVLGLYAYINGVLFVIAGILPYFGITGVFTPVMVFFSISTVLMIIKVQKYDGNIFDANGKLRKDGLVQLVVPLIITLATFVFVAVLIFSSTRSTKVDLLDEGVQIHGMYGETFVWSSIQAIELKDELPTIQRRTNGSAVGSKLRGHFQTQELGSVKLFVDANQPPFIYLMTNQKPTIFNMDNAEDTQEVFLKIENQLVNELE